MDKKMFTDLYNDNDFTKKIESLLKPFYKVNKTKFQDHAVDWEDFLQEMWCELFEEKRFNPDRAWCYNAIKCNAIDYCRDLQDGDAFEHAFSLDEVGIED